MAEKPPIVDLYRGLARLIMGEELGEEADRLESITGPFPARYLVCPNAVLLESNDQKIVKLSSEHEMAAAVMKFTTKQLFNLGDGYKWTAKQVNDFVKYFMLLAPTVPLPQSWAWKSDERYSFHKLPWDQNETSATPAWDEVLSRTTNAAALRCWIGSLFDADSDRQQYVWLHGGGQNSKGTILRFFEQVFGSSFASRFVPSKDSPFWTYGLLGKRLVAFPDTNNAGWVTTGLFKSLTGDDPIEVEKKNEMPFTARLECKFIFASQEKPRLSSEYADMRRVILCEMGAVDGPADPRYGHKLWEEGGAFLSKCMLEYQASCPSKGRIATDDAGLIDWIEDVESHYAAMLASDFYLVTAEPAGADDLLEPLRLARYLAYHFKSAIDRESFRKYLKRKGIEKFSLAGGAKRYSKIQFRDGTLWR